MSLRPLLLIGVGGTGGKVLGATRQYLLRHLHEQGVDRLPDAWQLLHIDIPAVRDSQERGLPFSLPAGDYSGLMTESADYTSEYAGVTARLRTEARERVVQAWDCWAPVPPGHVPGRISQGAGQLRAVGRVGALSRLSTLQLRIETAIRQLTNQTNLQQLDELASTLRLPPATRGSYEVFVVGSICGGSGSGMLVDVCDLLQANGVRNPVVLAYTPEVFDGTAADDDDGLGPNTYLALSELLNAAWRREPEEMPISRDVHYHAAGVANPRSSGGPGFLALVGRSNEHHQLAGGPEVFRTTGRMLSGMFLDPELLTNLLNFVSVNGASAQVVPDALELRPPHTSHGASFTRALGYSTLSVGREFFGEYARFRLLRHCAEQLLDAHLKDADPHVHKTADQLKQEAVQRAVATFHRELELNELGYDPATGQPHDDVFNAVTIQTTEAGKAMLAEFAHAVQQLVRDRSRPGLWGRSIPTRDAGAAAAQHVRDVTGPGQANQTQRAEELAHQRVEEYRRRLRDKLADQVPRSAAVRGLPVTIELLARVRAQLVAAAKELTNQAEERRSDARSRLSDLEAGFGVNRDSFRESDHAMVAYFVDAAQESLASYLRAQEMVLAARLCREIARGLIEPWARALQDAHDSLVHEVRPDGPVHLQPISHWPASTGVPAHYRPSPVEFTLDDVDAFPSEFERVVALRFPYGDEEERDVERARRESVNEAVRQILIGENIAPEGPVAVASYAYDWIPDLGGVAEPRPATVVARFSQTDLADRIQAWLRYPQSSTLTYLDATIGQHLTVRDDPYNTTLQKKRHARMASAFSEWLRASAPLLAFNSSLLAEVHSTPELGTTPVLGGIPVPNTLGELRRELEGRFRQTFRAEPLPNFDVPDMAGVSAFSFSAPFHPVTSTSVMKPLVSRNSIAWQFRRARPLSETVPLTVEARRDLVLGWFAGRLLGVAELSGTEQQTRARVLVDDRWVELDLSGLRPARPGRQYDAPGRVVESLLLALIESHRTSSLAPVRPFSRLISLGAACADPYGPVTTWVNAGAALPTSADALRLSEATTSEARSDVLRQRVQALQASFRHLLTVSAADAKPELAWGWVTREIAHDVEWALQRLEDAAAVPTDVPQA